MKLSPPQHFLRTGLLIFASMMLGINSPAFGQFLASPQPGDVYKEFSRYNSSSQFRVTEPTATNSRARADLPNTTLSLNVNDLAGAVRAELLIDYWLGHPGTTVKQFRFNNNSWITIPELSGNGIPSGQGECYMGQFNPVVNVPLNHLINGSNTLLGTCHDQSCYDFGWGLWGWWGVTLRVYYGPSKAHATGSITSPANGTTFGENPSVSVSASGGAGVSRVDVLAYYNGFDMDGDGSGLQYHEYYHRKKSETSLPIRGHVGTRTAAPYTFTWDTDLVPDQAASSVKLIARIRDNNGVWFVTNPVSNLTLQRTGSSVKIYKSTGIGPRFAVRTAYPNEYCYFNIPAGDNLGRVTSAKMMIATYNGVDGGHASGQTHFTKVNNWTAPSYGQDHFYSLDVLPLPSSALHNGSNTVHFYSNSSAHGIEVLWPGPALIVRYSGSSGPTAPSITQHPQNQSAAVGQTATFSVGASGTAPLAYQWQKNNADISGATSASYTTPAVVPTDNGATFRCRVTNAYGNVTSNNATLTVTIVGGGGANVIANPGFESGTGSWTFYTNGAGSFTSVVPGAQGLRAGKIDITTQGTNVQLYQSNIPLEANKTYKLTFTAYSNTSHDLSVSLLKQVSPYTSYGLNDFVVNLTGGWQTFTRQFTTSGFSGTINNARLRFWFAPYDVAGDDYFIDDVILQKVGSEPDMPAISKAPDPPIVESMPTEFGLQQNYPNPFNPSTTIRYQLPEAAHVTLKVYDVIGREVATLVDEQQNAGQFDVVLNGQDLASGVYFYRINAGNFTAMKRLVLMK